MPTEALAPRWRSRLKAAHAYVRAKQLQHQGVRLSRRLGNRDPHEIFSGVSDELWYWLNTEGRRVLPQIDGALPPLPAEEMQVEFTGRSGQSTIHDGYVGYRLIRDLASETLGDLEDRQVLDFGCGWGRLIRLFMRDVRSDNLLGVDCEPSVLDFCRAGNPWVRFELVDPLPPSGLPSSSFDLVYAYSVFSHLSEEAHLQWLAEFRRILRPGGLLAVTTRPREFIVRIRDAHLRGDRTGLPQVFPDPDHVLRTYDAGDYCYQATGGAGVLDRSFFGETCIPRRYVERQWSEMFEPLHFVEDRDRCEQNVILVRSRGPAARRG